MAHSAAAHTDHTSNAHSHPAPGVYLITFALLMILLFLTMGAYLLDFEKLIHFRGLNLIIALVIAIAKAALVVLYFMNVKFSTKLTWLWASLGFLWLLLMSGILMDYQTRAWLQPAGWQMTPSTGTSDLGKP